MVTDINTAYYSFINKNTSPSAKKAGNNLFAAQLENSKKVNTHSYINEIENCYPGTKVTVKSMTGSDVKKYYEEWKNEPINYNGFNHNITVSPKVLERMKNDPDYAEKMMKKIKSAAIPVGFENATLYEYKVIVRDDGEIETMACADFMNGKKQKTEPDEDDKKKDAKKPDPIYLHREIKNQWELIPFLENGIKSNQFFESQYLYNIEIGSKTTRD